MPLSLSLFILSGSAAMFGAALVALFVRAKDQQQVFWTAVALAAFLGVGVGFSGFTGRQCSVTLPEAFSEELPETLYDLRILGTEIRLDIWSEPATLQG